MTKDRYLIIDLMGKFLESNDLSLCYDSIELLINVAREDSRHEAIGWAYADCCATLDNGKDPRQTTMADVINRYSKDLS